MKNGYVVRVGRNKHQHRTLNEAFKCFTSETEKAIEKNNSCKIMLLRYKNGKRVLVDDVILS